ncbi:transcriptional regulator [Nocardioides gansuensis]|uniref:Transcriptional regulator n=1 Tax=Nocardioides gansuensis TaxID=2138300 RepID=A0A2T8FFM7_9ACTN|nr:helix-turn-helix domain-containing protein [Nocardioides gansuensis]PVG84506.1 transcriptional regulator [Nocardioides gansuensis]
MTEHHPLLDAIAPLLERIEGEVVAATAMRPGDVPLVWEGETVAAVRLPADDTAGATSLEDLIEEVAVEVGAPLADLPREAKQRAVRLLEERGAFAYRRSAETIAEALGVSRFTVYNYLNRAR